MKIYLFIFSFALGALSYGVYVFATDGHPRHLIVREMCNEAKWELPTCQKMLQEAKDGVMGKSS